MVSTINETGIENDNILRLWKDCHDPKRIELPSFSDYAPLGRWQNIAIEMVDARREDNQPGGTLLKYILKRRINLRQAATVEDQELIRVLTEHTIQPKTNVQRFINSDDIVMPPLPEQAILPPVKLEEVSPWTAGFVAFSQERSPEGYEPFHLGAALWTLATGAGRRVRIPLARPTFTALAIAFVARTSLFAKSATAESGILVLRAAGLGWLLGDDEATPQALLADMGGFIPPNYGDLNIDQQKALEKRLAMPGQLGWYYDEMNQLIDAMTRPGPMADFAGLLRKLDNCPDEYRYNTRTHGKAIIEKPYLAFLGSTTPANLARHTGKNAEFWGDGLWPRFAFIAPPPDKFKTKTMGLGEMPIPEYLSNKLREWNTRLGVPHCVISEIADEKGKPTGRYVAEREPLKHTDCIIDREAYQAYVNYREALRGLIANNRNQDLDGNYARLADKAIRIAGLIASLENNNRMTLPIWTLAQQIAEMFRENLHQLYNQINCTPEENPLEDILIAFLQQKGPSTAREISQFAPAELRKIKSTGIRDIAKGLERDGIVKIIVEGKKEVFTINTEV